MNQETIAFIGLGKMGLPMAQQLIANGYSVRGSDLSVPAMRSFVDAGGVACDHPADAASGAAVVITMLPDGGVVSDVVRSEAHGVLSTLAAGSLLIDMSSSAPGDTVQLHTDLTSAGYRMIDAPVSGGVARAVDGTLNIMAGGSEEDIAVARPILSAMGNSVVRTGDIGSGHAMKALNNFVSAAGAAASMEALIVGKAFGLDQSVMVDVLNGATGRNNTTEKKLKQFVISETYASGFGLGLMAKDIGIAEGLADQLGLSMDLLKTMSATWRNADDALGAGADHTELYRYIESKK